MAGVRPGDGRGTCADLLVFKVPVRGAGRAGGGGRCSFVAHLVPCRVCAWSRRFLGASHGLHVLHIFTWTFVSRWDSNWEGLVAKLSVGH